MTGIKRHEFNEAHLDVVLARECGKVCHLIFVVTAHYDGVDLDRLQARRLRGCEALEHSIQNIDAGHLPEHIALQTVEADRDAIQPGVFQTLRAIGQIVTVGGQRPRVAQLFYVGLMPCQFRQLTRS